MIFFSRVGRTGNTANRSCRELLAELGGNDLSFLERSTAASH